VNLEGKFLSKRGAVSKAGVFFSKIVEKRRKTVGLRQDKSGPSDESRGPDSITV